MPRPLHGSSHSIAERQPKVADEHSALKLCRDGGSAQTSACSTCRHLRAARSTRPHPTPASPNATSPRPTLGKQAHSRGAESQPRRQPSQPVGAGPQLHFNIWVEPPVNSNGNFTATPPQPCPPTAPRNLRTQWKTFYFSSSPHRPVFQYPHRHLPACHPSPRLASHNAQRCSPSELPSQTALPISPTPHHIP